MAEIHLGDIRTTQGFISLSGLVGKHIKDITGYLTKQSGEVVFKVCDIVLEDDTEIDVEGDYDFPYLSIYVSMPQPNMDSETLERLYDEQS